MFTNITDATKWIESVHKFRTINDLSPMTNMCKHFGSPQHNLNAIHIGGTNGKGSTVAMLKQILLNSNIKVSTFTSPHILSFNERITYNGNDINDNELINYINRIYDSNVVEIFKPSYFDIVTLIAILYFNDVKPDLCIFEVGLGGTLDSTNVVSTKLCAITNIGLDHTNILGNTHTEILFQKLGIVDNNQLLITSMDKKYKHILEDKKINYKFISEVSEIQVNNSYTTFNYNNKTYNTSLIGIHQAYNASLVIEILNNLEFSISDNNIIKGLNNTTHVGRFEISNNIIIDGAHNKEGLENLISSIKSIYNDKEIHCIFSVLEDKLDTELISKLNNFEKVYFTDFPFYRCANRNDLYKLSNHSNKQILNQEELADLINSTNKNQILLVTGSLYFISYLKQNNYV